MMFLLGTAGQQGGSGSVSVLSSKHQVMGESLRRVLKRLSETEYLSNAPSLYREGNRPGEGRQLAHSDKWAGDPQGQKLSDFGRVLSEALWSFCRPGPAQNTVGAQEIPAKVTAQM